MSYRSSLLRLISRIDTLTRNLPGPNRTTHFVGEQGKPLGRWCHEGYNPTCDTIKKVDMANLDNSLCVKTNTEQTRMHQGD